MLASLYQTGATLRNRFHRESSYKQLSEAANDSTLSANGLSPDSIDFAMASQAPIKPEHLDQEVLAFLTAFPNSHDTALVSPHDTPVLVNHPEMTLTGPKILLTGRSEDGLTDHGKFFDGYNTKSISATRDARGGITVKIFDSPETPNRENECFSPLFLDKATKQMRYSANRGFKRNVVDYQNGAPAEGFTVIEYYNPRLIEGVERGKEQIELQREAYEKRLAEAAKKSEISANA